MEPKREERTNGDFQRDWKEDIVKNQTELLPTTDEELRQRGRKDWTRKGMGFWVAWGCTLSEGGKRVTAELLNPGHHWLCPTIDQLRGLLASAHGACIRVIRDACFTTPNPRHRSRRTL